MKMLFGQFFGWAQLGRECGTGGRGCMIGVFGRAGHLHAFSAASATRSFCGRVLMEEGLHLLVAWE